MHQENSDCVQEEYLCILKNREYTSENIKKLIDFAIQKGGIEYAQQKMLQFKDQALKLIENSKNKEIKESLIKVLDHTINRKK